MGVEAVITRCGASGSVEGDSCGLQQCPFPLFLPAFHDVRVRVLLLCDIVLESTPLFFPIFIHVYVFATNFFFFLILTFLC